jgi:hypothetical protein
MDAGKIHVLDGEADDVELVVLEEDDVCVYEQLPVPELAAVEEDEGVAIVLPVFELAELKEDDCETVELFRVEELRLLDELVARLVELVEVGLEGITFAAVIS